jgi:hypothetical protein
MLSLKFTQNVIKPEIVVGTHTTDFIYLTANSTATMEDSPDFEPGTYEIEYRVNTMPLSPGSYCLRVAIFDQYRRLIYSGETLKIFNVLPTKDEAKQAPLRLIDTSCEWLMQNKLYNSSLPTENHI